ncbi:MAG TPA: Asp-tRNA(Asn)/Glu-tRNA(Gln) amidotransferase subunit GatA [Gemmatimonadaceae bacterium]|nr:Asp-tRNA(Asn)/Glu-tRNA(Gln) amidotransferase subunit GatA [Gemmatimonadaceae bacterium]
MSASLLDAGAAAIAAAVHADASVADQVVATALERVRSTHEGAQGLNAVLHRARAEALTGALPDGALRGVPVVVKDNIATLELPTSCGSRMLEGWVSPYEATVVRKLREAGAVVVGKTNMDEFAMGSSTENSAYGPTRNPVDRSRAPGGSSGGSAAAVAAAIAPIGLGSETGGSVRQPAAFCGVVGVKPTYGRVSRFGLVAFASSLDAVGVFGRTVDDAAIATETISGHDVHDATSSDRGVPTMRGAPGSLDGLVVGIPREYFPDSLHPDVRARCDRALDALRSLGAVVREVSLPHTALAIPVYYIIAPAEASANLARFDGVRYGLRAESDSLRGLYDGTRARGFGPEVTRRILLGTYVLSAGFYDAYYRKAQDVRALIARDFDAVFSSGVDVLFTPTTPTPAFALGAISDPYEMYLSDIFTVTANLAGIPAMSLPIGRVDGLPVGGQLLAGHFQEPQMFRVAYALEDALGAEAHR